MVIYLVIRPTNNEKIWKKVVNWCVSLFGSENELKQLRDFLDSPNCRLEFDKTNKRCYLTACRFSNLTDPKKVCESAKKLLAMIRAFSKIELGGDFLSVNVGQGKIIVDSKNNASIVRERVDGRDVWVYQTVVPTATTSVNRVEVTVSGSVKTSDAEFSKPSEREERWYDYYLNRCDEKIDSTVLFEALFYFAQVTSWYSLYKVFKTIQSKNKITKMLEDRWVDKDKLKRFRTSAQYYDALGGAKDAYLGLDGGRHTLSESQKKMKEEEDEALKKGKRYRPPPPVMHIAEAENLIRNLLKKWLESAQTIT
jgi:hypothetical protein